MTRDQALSALQQVDAAIRTERARLADLGNPAPSELRLVELDAEIAELAAKLREAESQVRGMELEAGTLRDRLRSHDRQLMGGSIRNPKELTQLQGEVEHLRAQLSAHEDSELESMGVIEDLSAQLAARRTARDLLAAEAEAENAQRALARSSAEREIKDLESRRGQPAGVLSPAELALYEKLLQRRGGIAVSRAHGGQCGVCRMALPPARLQQIRVSRDPVTCESCERILVLD